MTAPERIWLGKWWSVAPTKTSEDDAEYIRADLAAVPAQVRVKPLVWGNVQTGCGPETYQAYGATGFYQVFTDEDSSAGAVFAEFATNDGQFGTIHARSVARVGGFIEAKAAAQADYEARILAALEPVSDPRTADYEQAYQYALTLADALISKHYPDNKDWRPLGDLTGLLTQIDNMVAGKMPDPRDEVIARLVEAAEHLLRNYLQDELDEPDLCVNDDHWTAIHDVDAALAAAKVVQHD